MNEKHRKQNESIENRESFSSTCSYAMKSKRRLKLLLAIEVKINNNNNIQCSRVCLFAFLLNISIIFFEYFNGWQGDL